MLPIISEENAAIAFSEIFKDVPEWRKKMIHYLKEENPEINTAIIEAARSESGSFRCIYDIQPYRTCYERE